MEKLTKLKEWVRDEWENRSHSWGYPYTKLITSEEDVNHLLSCSESILMTKYPELGGYPGGGFVQAVVDNNLMEAFGRADSVNSLGMKFHLEILYNFNPDRL